MYTYYSLLLYTINDEKVHSFPSRSSRPQNPVQRGRLDAQIFNLQTQLNQIMHSLRTVMGDARSGNGVYHGVPKKQRV